MKGDQMGMICGATSTGNVGKNRMKVDMNPKKKKENKKKKKKGR